MTETRLKVWVALLSLLDVSKLALNVLVGFLIVEYLFEHLKEGVRIKFKKFLHEALVCAEPNNVHGVKTPTLLAQTALWELLALQKQLYHPENFVTNISCAVLYLKLQTSGFLKHFLLVLILQLHAVRVRKFKNRGSVILQIYS